MKNVKLEEKEFDRFTDQEKGSLTAMREVAKQVGVSNWGDKGGAKSFYLNLLKRVTSSSVLEGLSAEKKAEMTSDGEALEAYIEQQLGPSIGANAFGSIGSAEKILTAVHNIDLLWVKIEKSQGRELDPIPLDQLLTKTGFLEFIDRLPLPNIMKNVKLEEKEFDLFKDKEKGSLTAMREVAKSFGVANWGKNGGAKSFYLKILKRVTSSSVLEGLSAEKKAEMISDGEALKVYIDQQLGPRIGAGAFVNIGAAEKILTAMHNMDLLLVKIKKNMGEKMSPIEKRELITKEGAEKFFSRIDEMK